MELKATKQVVETHTLEVGHKIAASHSGSWKVVEGKVTHIFDGGKRCIINDNEVVWTERIDMINGKKIR